MCIQQILKRIKFGIYFLTMLTELLDPSDSLVSYNVTTVLLHWNNSSKIMHIY